jgi:hypothetical protein
MGRTASGVRGITLKDDKDEVIGMVSVDKKMLRFSDFSCNRKWLRKTYQIS